ncbi:MerR family transcriptional regulator [Nocardiopsis gilva YIM 90087]|uniref:MerR family transcriptional regulator n=1 Tax=Nocardiopsis gilva YIM 90087 TaxID=1235441 RepID=A0A223S0V8_9ACTN|nr:MerR family transcriptional regulator [Nocardiopsis gilva]ASU81727.1 MerR family transcriptional regulator [Nocardiopsis gilva YIM 90087]
MSYPVGEVARIAKVTVRTLHHYDEIGLLSPGERSATGYRRYDDADLDRLHRILGYRELGFPLEDIAALLDEPGTDTYDHLRRQRRLLEDRAQRLNGMIAALDKEMEAYDMGISLTPEERLELFGDSFDTEGYAEEARKRWGDTDQWAESQRRTADYTKDDWIRIKGEGAEVEQRLVDAFTSGATPDSEQAMDAVEEHRKQVERWFYECPHEMHLKLTGIYPEDPRFSAYYDAMAEGLAVYIRDAAEANARRHSH